MTVKLSSWCAVAFAAGFGLAMMGGAAWIAWPIAHPRAIPAARAGYTDPAVSRAVGQLALFAPFVAHTLGAQVEFGEPSVGHAGETDSRTRTIIVDASMSPGAKFATLAHEAAHLIQPGELTPQEGEVFAECVAERVCKAWGVDCGPFEPYLARFKNAASVRRTYADEIDWAVVVLSGSVEDGKR